MYTLQLSVNQDTSKPDNGFTLPYRGTLETIDYNFVVTVNPCTILSYTASDKPADVDITIGDPMTTSGVYSTLQTPNCGYPETVNVTSLPSFVTHDSSSKNFSFQTSDPNDIGEHTVRLVSTIRVPDDAL